MTPAQINRKYDRGFIMVVTSNGVEGNDHLIQFVKFAEAKRRAIDCLTATLDRHHGRGDHTVTLYGAMLVDTTTPEDHKVGFGPQWEDVRGEAVFTL